MGNFVKGDVVKLVGSDRSYEALVTGPGYDEECFAAVITKSDFGVDDHHGVLTVGSYDTDFNISEFVLVG